jgi:hypothetical protein
MPTSDTGTAEDAYIKSVKKAKQLEEDKKKREKPWLTTTLQQLIAFRVGKHPLRVPQTLQRFVVEGNQPQDVKNLSHFFSTKL